MMTDLMRLAALVLAGTMATRPALSQETAPVPTDQRGSLVLLYEGDLTAHTRIGSGFVIRGDGTLVTRYRFVARHAPLIARLGNGEWYTDLQLVDADTLRDVAILRFKGFDVPALPLGNSNSMTPGAPLTAVTLGDDLEGAVAQGTIGVIETAARGYRVFRASLPCAGVAAGTAVFGAAGEVIGIADAGESGADVLPINYARALDLDAPPRPLGPRVLAPATDATVAAGPAAPAADPAAVIGRLSEQARAFHELIDDAYDDANYNYEGVQVTWRSPNIYQAADRLRELARDAAGLGDEAAADDSLQRIVAEYAYLIAKASQVANGLATSPTRDGMDYAATARVNLLREDAPDLARTFREYVRNHHPDLLDSLTPTVRHGPINRHASYGITIADSAQGVTVTAADGKTFQVGDVILGTRDGPDFADAHAFRKHVYRLEPGNRTRYRILRNGVVVDVRATIGKRETR